MAEHRRGGVNLVRERLTRVFQFLKALHEMRNPVQREVTEQPWTLWFHDLPDHPAIQRGASPVVVRDEEEEGGDESADLRDSTTDGADFALRVQRPELTAPPSPPAELERWLEPGWERPENDKVGIRKLWSETRAGVQEVFKFEDDPQRVRLLEQWLGKRDEWLKQERPARKAMAVFEKLYALQATLERESERVELMLGDGLLVWNRRELPVHHPVLLQRVQLVFEPSIPEFRLVETEHPPELYTALFRTMGDVSAQAITRLRDDLAQNMWHPLGGDDTAAFLKRVVTELSPPYGQFAADGAPVGYREAPRINRDPVIFLRLRTLGFGAAIESILEDLPTQTDLPDGLTSIVGVEPGGWAHGPSDDLSVEIDPNGEDEHILLSKEANAGQVEIARRLDRFGAVLVQGPPGTGKTHTIANLLGHLLAQGKSVLVTAHTTKALRVLRDHVVEPLRPLCVSVLDGTSKQLESSVEEISSRLSESSDDVLEREANALEGERKHILRQLRATREELLQGRESEYSSIVVAGAEYDPSQAARRVAAGAAAHSWIPSPITPGAPLPLSVGELADLYHTNELLTRQDQEELSLGLPDPAYLMAPSDFALLCETRARLESVELDFRADVWEEPEQGPSKAALADLLEQITHAVRILGEGEGWRLSAIMAGREGGPRRQAWEELLADVQATYTAASRAHPLLVRFAPTIPEDCLPGRLLPALESLGQYLRKGGKITAVQLLLHRDWKAIVEAARVNGDAPRVPEHIDALKAFAELREARVHLLERWTRQVSALGGPGPETLGLEPEQACRQFVPLIQQALDWFADTWLPLERQFREQGLRWDAVLAEVPPDLTAFGALLRLRTLVSEHLPEICAAQVARLEREATDGQLRDLTARLDAAVGGRADAPTLRGLREAVGMLDPEAYQESFEKLVGLRTRQRFVDLRHDFLARLETAAPAWAASIRNREGFHGGVALPGDPHEAWLWRQLNDELDRRGAVSLEDLQARANQLRRELLRLTAELIEKRTWAAQVRRTTLPQRQALKGWKKCMTKAGKQTGRRAPRLLAEARSLMPVCQSAVPVWIMPLSQVVENFDPRRNRFDVVIIDEASQADAMALTALYMGRQVIVVGDPEQVTPDAVGQRMDEVQQLIDTFLKDIPNAQLYDGQTSVYDLAETSFGGVVKLREHFRCVPDIIQFSNFLSYKGEIQPLRDSSTVRLRPHTVAYRVKGTSSDRKTNEIEARTVASLLIAATEQPEYSDASFGVVSLVGADQAARVDLLLQRFLSPGEYHRRRVQCGNPAEFQGDERDVVFLSMVYSPLGNGPLPRVPDPGERIKKRFNVAASRARDQLWVVHSVDPERDLQAEDIRRHLLLHARDPKATEALLGQLEPRTESEFEKQVLRQLVSKGYKVTPQWRVGPYRIDMVVEDGGHRLAVECDGERYHPPDKLREDLARQAILERMGWRFVRIRGSTFFRNPDEAMAPVFVRLESLGIRPVGREPSGDRLDAVAEDLKDRVIRRADELRREWDELGDELMLARRRHGGSARFDAHRREEASAEKEAAKGKGVGSEDGLKASQKPDRPESETPSPGPSTSKPLRPKPVPSKAPQGLQGAGPVRQPGPPVVAGGNRKSPPAIPSAPSASAKPTEALDARTPRVDGQLDVVEFLRSRHLEVIDKRASGGALWVVGGQEISGLLNGLRAKGLRFSFAKNGGKATKNRPAWFAK